MIKKSIVLYPGGVLIRHEDGVQFGIHKGIFQDPFAEETVAVFTRISFFFDWIASTTGLNLPKCQSKKNLNWEKQAGNWWPRIKGRLSHSGRSKCRLLALNATLRSTENFFSWLPFFQWSSNKCPSFRWFNKNSNILIMFNPPLNHYLRLYTFDPLHLWVNFTFPFFVFIQTHSLTDLLETHIIQIPSWKKNKAKNSSAIMGLNSEITRYATVIMAPFFCFLSSEDEPLKLRFDAVDGFGGDEEIDYNCFPTQATTMTGGVSEMESWSVGIFQLKYHSAIDGNAVEHAFRSNHTWFCVCLCVLKLDDYVNIHSNFLVQVGETMTSHIKYASWREKVKPTFEKIILFTESEYGTCVDVSLHPLRTRKLWN